MTENRHIERMIASLSDSIDWPSPSPFMAGRVVARIEAGPATPLVPRRRRLAVATAAVLVAIGVILLSPSVREAAADLLGAAGVRIGFTSDEPAMVGADLELGDPVTVDQAGAAVDFDVRLPAGAIPGPPDGVYATSEGQVTMVWEGTDLLPATEGSDVALLFSQRAAYGLQDFAEKIVGGSTVVVAIEVEGQPAFWIEGAPHTVTMLDREGSPIEETTRLAANVLLWESGGVNHRLETTGDLESSLAFVDQLEALP